jgi:hypothetical protein
LNQAKTPEWHEAMVNANIDIFEMTYEESVSYFKSLEKLEKIKHTNGLNPSSLPLNNKKRVSVTSNVGKSSKNHKGSNMWCHYCDKNNHNTADKTNAVRRSTTKAEFIFSTEINGVTYH